MEFVLYGAILLIVLGLVGLWLACRKTRSTDLP